tara:strand:- start:144 stop:362 length:219 start_codon:yes stop_codon:yes gene_type:complete
MGRSLRLVVVAKQGLSSPPCRLRLHVLYLPSTTDPLAVKTREARQKTEPANAWCAERSHIVYKKGQILYPKM